MGHRRERGTGGKSKQNPREAPQVWFLGLGPQEHPPLSACSGHTPPAKAVPLPPPWPEMGHEQEA